MLPPQAPIIALLRRTSTVLRNDNVDALDGCSAAPVLSRDDDRVASPRHRLGEIPEVSVRLDIRYLLAIDDQGRSGLGLQAQRSAIRAFATREGFEVAHWFTEVETGKGRDALDVQWDAGAGAGLSSESIAARRRGAAAAIVRLFLKEQADYPQRLRLKILRAADPVFRAAKIVGER